VRLTLRQLQIFNAVAQTGTTTAAAELVALSQSATSAALKDLENALNVRLFDRVGKRLVLNEIGRSLQMDARALVERAQDLEQSFTAAGPTTVKMQLAASTTIGNYLLPKVLRSFHGAWPLATIDLRIGNTLDVAQAVERFESDLGLIEGPCHVPTLRIIPWRDDDLVVVAAPDHELARVACCAPLDLTTLRDAPWLLREHGSGTRETVEQALMPHLNFLNGTMYLGSSEAIKNCVAAGLGISCLSRILVEDMLGDGRLCLLPTCLPLMTRKLSVVHRPERIFSPALRAFLAQCGLGAEIYS